MTILNRLAHSLNRRDELPNQELAVELAESQDRQAIAEIAMSLWHPDSNIRGDCIKVLYEIGYRNPHLISDYAGDFLKLLKSRNNRLVWGAMIALSTVAEIAADEIYPQAATIQKAMERGSVITVDAGVTTLARLAASNDERRREILPYLFKHLQTCRPKDVPQHAEKIAEAVSTQERETFLAILHKRIEDMNPTQAKRLNKVIRQFS